MSHMSLAVFVISRTLEHVLSEVIAVTAAKNLWELMACVFRVLTGSYPLNLVTDVYVTHLLVSDVAQGLPSFCLE